MESLVRSLVRRTWHGLTIRYASCRNSSAVSVQGFLVAGIDEPCFESSLLRVGVRSVIVGMASSGIVMCCCFYTTVHLSIGHPTSLRRWSVPHPAFVYPRGREYKIRTGDVELVKHVRTLIIVDV